MDTAVNIILFFEVCASMAYNKVRNLLFSDKSAGLVLIQRIWRKGFNAADAIVVRKPFEGETIVSPTWVDVRSYIISLFSEKSEILHIDDEIVDGKTVKYSVKLSDVETYWRETIEGRTSTYIDVDGNRRYYASLIVNCCKKLYGKTELIIPFVVQDFATIDAVRQFQNEQNINDGKDALKVMTKYNLDCIFNNWMLTKRQSASDIGHSEKFLRGQEQCASCYVSVLFILTTIKNPVLGRILSRDDAEKLVFSDKDFLPIGFYANKTNIVQTCGKVASEKTPFKKGKGYADLLDSLNPTTKDKTLSLKVLQSKRLQSYMLNCILSAMEASDESLLDDVLSVVAEIEEMQTVKEVLSEKMQELIQIEA